MSKKNEQAKQELQDLNDVAEMEMLPDLAVGAESIATPDVTAGPVATVAKPKKYSVLRAISFGGVYLAAGSQVAMSDSDAAAFGTDYVKEIAG